MNAKQTIVPKEYFCPISGLIMIDPVNTVDGQTYEREEIERWLIIDGKDTSPLTGLKLSSKALTPVIIIRNQINTFLEANPQLVVEGKLYLPIASLDKLRVFVEQNRWSDFVAIVKKDFHVLVMPHPETQYTGIQIICESGTYEMLNYAVNTLRQYSCLQSLTSNTKPKYWLPKLLINELPRALQANEREKIELMKMFGVHTGTYNEMLLEACRLGILECVRSLIQVGANVDCRGNEGMTPLIKAACKGFDQIVHELLSRGADPNGITDEGWSALHWSVENNHQTTTGYLISAGGDLHKADKLGKTPMSLAKKNPLMEDFINSYIRNLILSSHKKIITLEAELIRQNRLLESMSTRLAQLESTRQSSPEPDQKRPKQETGSNYFFSTK